MARLVEITQPSDFIACDDNRRAVVAFTVSNINNTAIRFGAKVLVDTPTREEWFELEGGPEWNLAANGTDQITVRIEVPAEVEAGEYKFRILVYSIEYPGEDFTKGEPVSINVNEILTPPPPPPFPIWIVVVVVAVLLVGGGGTIWYFVSRPEPVPEPKPEMVKLPLVEKQSFANAYQKITAAGLEVGKVTPQVITSGKEDYIIKQYPHPRTSAEVEKGTPVNLTVGKMLKIYVPPPEFRKQMIMKASPQIVPREIENKKKE